MLFTINQVKHSIPFDDSYEFLSLNGKIRSVLFEDQRVNEIWSEFIFEDCDFKLDFRKNEESSIPQNTEVKGRGKFTLNKNGHSQGYLIIFVDVSKFNYLSSTLIKNTNPKIFLIEERGVKIHHYSDDQFEADVEFVLHDLEITY
jgi:hypothetical protein